MKKLNIITTYMDLKNYVSNLLCAYDAQQYDMEHDEFVYHVTNNYRDLLDEKGFSWGDDLPEITDQEWHEIVEN